MSKTLLFDEYPLSVSPSLATLLKLERAHLIQEIHYINQHKALDPERYQDHFADGHYWAIFTYEQWADRCPWLGAARTIQRMVDWLFERDLIVVRQQKRRYNKRTKRQEGDNTYWYRVNYDALAEYVRCNEDTLTTARVRQRLAKKEHQDKMASCPPPIKTDCPDPSSQSGMTHDAKVASYTESTNTESLSSDIKDSSLSSGDAGGTKQKPPDKPPKAPRRAKALQEDGMDEQTVQWVEQLMKYMPVGRKTAHAQAYTNLCNPPKDRYCKEFIPITPEIFELMLAKIQLFAEHLWPYTDLEFVPHLGSWISAGRFYTEDEEIIAAGQAKRRRNGPSTAVTTAAGSPPAPRKNKTSEVADDWLAGMTGDDGSDAITIQANFEDLSNRSDV